MKRQLSNTIYGLKVAIEKNDFERLNSSVGKKRNNFFANPIRFKLLPHPLYFPNLALRDFYLFPNLKRWLQGQRFSSNEEDK